MKITKLFLIIPIAVLSLSLSVGCGSDEPTVVPEEDVTMTEAEEEEYAEESYGSADDESQN